MAHPEETPHNEPRRVVVHMGFHKTGTTSVQAVFRHNGKRLEPLVRVILRDNMRPAAWAANRAASAKLFRWLFRRLLRWLFARLLRARSGAVDPRPVIISCETLAGVIPGQKGTWSYAAAPALTLDVLKAVYEVYGAQTEVTVACTVRQADAWTDSAWRHLRDRDGLRLDLASYTARLGGPLDTAAWAKRVADAVAPTPVRVLALEETSSYRLFAAGPMLRLAGLDSDALRALRPVKPRNVGAP